MLKVATGDASNILFAATQTTLYFVDPPGVRCREDGADARRPLDRDRHQQGCASRWPTRCARSSRSTAASTSHEIANTVTSDATISVVGVVDGMDEAWRTLQDSSCDVLVVACQGYSERALALIDGAVKQDPDRPVLVLGQGSPSGFVRRVFEAGADDILMLPQTPDQVRFSIHKLVARKSAQGASARPAQQGRLICVLGPKGGSGKTLVSANLGVALAQAGESVAIVDLDLQFGDVALCLGLGPERTFYDLALAGGTLDAQKLDAYLMPHSTGAARAPRPDAARPGELDHGRADPRRLRLAALDVRRRHRRHAARASRPR